MKGGAGSMIPQKSTEVLAGMPHNKWFKSFASLSETALPLLLARYRTAKGDKP